MSKKLLFLISFVLLLGLVGSASAQVKFQYRASWWSDLGPGHLWSEPNNWWTMDRYYVDNDDSNDRGYGEALIYVKVHPNQVPDMNCAAIIGKGGAREIYPRYLHDLIEAGYSMTDPTLDSGTWEAYYFQCGGGESFDPNVGGGTPDPDANHDDPCRHHDFWMTGGTLTLGEPQTWDGYDYVYYDGMFYGQWSPGRLCIAVVPSGGGTASGTMHMSGGTVNVGGHVEVASWGATGLLDMTGGEINITQGLYSSGSHWGAVGQVNLHGGTINARYFTIQSGEWSTGSIDIGGGKMVLERDEVQKIQDYYDGNVERASVTLYGGVSHGGIDPCTGMRVAFSLDYDVSNEGKTTVQTFLTEPNQAWNPSPPNGAGNVRGTIANIARPVLSWSPGDGATSHEVYFDVNEALVSARDVSVRKQTVYDPCSWTVDIDLTSLQTYYWAIDENPGPTLGQVWSFTMANLAKAGLPSPADGATDVNPVVNLAWAEGILAVTHDVYFSTDFNDVNDRLIDPCNTGTNSYDPPGDGLDILTTYFWRVDECNAAGGPQWPGDVWSFTTSDHIDVDDFDSYADTGALRGTWRDYWFNPAGKNGAQVFVETTPDLVLGGNSMMYYYRNFETSGGKFVGSTAEASTTDLEVGTDWTASGVEALVVNFHGHTANGQEAYSFYTLLNDQMWVSVEDGVGNEGIVRYPDMNAVMEASWHEWNIDLEDPCLISVDMNNVVKVYIGFGGQKGGQAKGGAGYQDAIGDTVWFDDIALYPPRCIPAYTLATDFTEDCVVDEGDFDIMANTWLLTDYNTVGYSGVLRGFLPDDDPNGPHWVPGRIGTYALEFGVGSSRADPNNDHPNTSEPPLNDDVLIPPLNLNTNKMSASCWIKRHGTQWDDTAWWGSNFHHGEFAGVGSTTCHFTVANREPESLGINWNNETWSWQFDPIVPVLPNNIWAFCAVVVEPTNVTIYTKHDGDPVLYSDSPGKAPSVEVLAFDTPSTVASNKWRYIDGVIDDLRIFDYSLSQAEVEWLAYEEAQGTEPNLPFSWYKFDDGSGFTALDSGGGGIVYHPVASQANLVDPEPQYSRSVNFRDFVVLAKDWLKESPWPPRP
jgi:hypothetical protein